MSGYYSGRERPVDHSVTGTVEADKMGKVENALFRVLVEAPVMAMAALVELGMPKERPINADVPREGRPSPDFAADAEFIERELFVPEDPDLN